MAGAKRGERARVRDEARAFYKQAILGAAEEVFAASGFHAARVQDIARHARLAVGTIYNHFPQKEDILIALLDVRMRDVVDRLAPAKGERDERDYPTTLARRVERLLTYIDEHRDFFVLATEHGLLGEATGGAKHALGERALPHVERFDRALRALMAVGISGGALAPADLGLLAAFFKNTIRGVGRWARERGSSRHDETAQLIVNLFIDGAARRGRAPKRRTTSPGRAKRT